MSPQLLFQETNPGVRYQYTIQRPADSENEIEQTEFLWRFGSWTTCTATCGTGESRTATLRHGAPKGLGAQPVRQHFSINPRSISHSKQFKC